MSPEQYGRWVTNGPPPNVELYGIARDLFLHGFITVNDLRCPEGWRDWQRLDRK